MEREERGCWRQQRTSAEITWISTSGASAGQSVPIVPSPAIRSRCPRCALPCCQCCWANWLTQGPGQQVTRAWPPTRTRAEHTRSREPRQSSSMCVVLSGWRTSPSLQSHADSRVGRERRSDFERHARQATTKRGRSRTRQSTHTLHRPTWPMSGPVANRSER